MLGGNNEDAGCLAGTGSMAVGDCKAVGDCMVNPDRKVNGGCLDVVAMWRGTTLLLIPVSEWWIETVGSGGAEREENQVLEQKFLRSRDDLRLRWRSRAHARSQYVSRTGCIILLNLVSKPKGCRAAILTAPSAALNLVRGPAAVRLIVPLL
ncbi:hypothetical protein PHYPSEUDO_014550 [Phytophthora pseudosyringae]|uniref:Uncharacterized protein n=1 Tax=Phytophthora pseudosyringae TaxID=221518 RepID=A0A8T1W595_9STRA|nr:hypothetical protein PHYPSEUDO_014550 [Phytophthora pseudosyringae]